MNFVSFVILSIFQSLLCLHHQQVRKPATIQHGIYEQIFLRFVWLSARRRKTNTNTSIQTRQKAEDPRFRAIFLSLTLALTRERTYMRKLSIENIPDRWLCFFLFRLYMFWRETWNPMPIFNELTHRLCRMHYSIRRSSRIRISSEKPTLFLAKLCLHDDFLRLIWKWCCRFAVRQATQNIHRRRSDEWHCTLLYYRIFEPWKSAFYCVYYYIFFPRSCFCVKSLRPMYINVRSLRRLILFSNIRLRDVRSNHFLAVAHSPSLCVWVFMSPAAIQLTILLLTGNTHFAREPFSFCSHFFLHDSSNEWHFRETIFVNN